jgi:crotonobetainyl-CoA:carnitine CoA-transferase CaiB-like acyl-CoA transferase
MTEIEEAPGGASALPLADITVLDATSVIAGPVTSMLLADFGATVIKIEHPNGDPLREHGDSKDGVPLWWTMVGRSKRCITLYLGTPEGQELFRRLARDVDVVIENFRVGTMRRWGLDYETLLQENPRLVMAHITGFGQHGPRSREPGFGTLAEAMSGFAHRTGDPDGPPMLPPFGLADGVAGLSGAYAIMVALHERNRTGAGQEIDLAITDPLLTLLEPQVMTYDQLGIDLVRTGNRAATNAPRGIYRSADGRWLAVSASTVSTAQRLLSMCGRPDIAALDWMRSAESRSAHAEEIDAVLVPWFRERTHTEILDACRAADAPASLVYAPSDIVTDEQFAATGAITAVKHERLGEIRMPNVLFRLSRTPGAIRWTGPELGAHNAEVYGALGLDDDDLARLRADGTI